MDNRNNLFSENSFEEENDNELFPQKIEPTFDDPILQEAWYYLTKTTEPIFITGDAGTGKTTLIKTFMDWTSDRFAILAPTGVAAMNAGGQTIHSFYGFRAGAISYDTIKNLDNDFKARKLHNAIDGIIIDEISMVRADLMDNVYNFYHKNYGDEKPFGGRRIIVVGDLDQLPPVVSSDEERKYIFHTYGHEFFTAAKCWERCKLRIIKLKKVWRQTDQKFISLLNNIKNNKITDDEINDINNSCVKAKMSYEDGIVLSSTNQISANINLKMLERLEGKQYTFVGKADGQFNEKNIPVEPIIEIKLNARVMLCINDYETKPPRYVNGSLGTLVNILPECEIMLPPRTREEFIEPHYYSGEALEVLIDGHEKTVLVAPYTFEQKKYTFNEETKKLNEQVVSSFTQYPIKLAYAITIHKSQGMTYDKIIIDLGKGAFAHGQLYVALSRCRTLEGISLRVPIKRSDLIYNLHILEFNKKLLQQ